MKKLANNKKGFDAFTFILTIISISVLVMILIGLTVKYNKLSTTLGGAGSQAAFVLQIYDNADSTLLYLDNSVQLSMRQAVFDLGDRGFDSSPSSCISFGYLLWSEGDHEVIEGKDECKATLASSCTIPTNLNGDFEFLFSSKLNSYISSYNDESEVKLIESNYDDLRLSSPSGNLEVIGIAGNPFVIEKPNLKYEIKPSFRESIDIDLIGDFNKITEKATALIEKKEDALKSKLTSYNNENEGLRWVLPVDGYDRDCRSSNECFVKDCIFNKKECEMIDNVCPVDAAGAKIDPDCPDRIEDCHTVSVPGKFVHKYCSVTADIIVKIIDDKYRLEGEAEGYKKFLTIDGDNPVTEEYAYRFALNWFEMEDADCFEK